MKLFAVYSIKCQCCPHIETSQLICCANKLTGFYMGATMVFNWLTIESGWNSYIESQPAITCSTLTIKTLEQGVKYVQS